MKKIGFLCVALCSLVGSLQAHEKMGIPHVPMNFSQEFWGDSNDYYDTKCFEYDLLIAMITNSCEPLKTTMLKTMLLVKLKKDEIVTRSTIESLKRPIDYLKGFSDPRDLENSQREREEALARAQRYIKELQRAERFTK